jgi:hypothetical protein
MKEALDASRRAAAGAFALAAGGVAAAAALRWVLGPALGADVPLIFFPRPSSWPRYAAACGSAC